MSDTIHLRIKSKGYSLTVMPNVESDAKSMGDDVRILAKAWAEHFGLKPVSVEKSEVEFILKSTLDYIEQLEGVLEGLQANPDTPDDLLEEIERVLR